MSEEIKRCGDCKHYMGKMKNGKMMHFGFCGLKDKYKQDCNRACKKNFEEKGANDNADL